MKISEPKSEYNTKELNITKALYLNNYKIALEFNDGKKRIIDFGGFLKKSNHPEIKKYLDKKLFRKFIVFYGNLNWNDYDLIFPISDLYNGQIN